MKPGERVNLIREISGRMNQDDTMTQALQSQQYQDTWNFNWTGQFNYLIFAHQFITGTSSNPNDPVLIIDPWNNFIKRK